MGLTAYVGQCTRFAALSGSKKIRVGGTTYRTRGFLINKLAWDHGRPPYEPWLDAVYETLLGCKEGAFVDVGASTGQIMLKILGLDKTRQYVGFEPHVACCSLIQSFIEENNLKSHTILPFGLSNQNQMVKLHIRRGDYFRRGDYDSAASIVEKFRPDSFYAASRCIYVRKGDELLEDLKIGRVSTIKMDVEGAELEVIEGLASTIQEKTPFIIFEVLNHYLAATGQKLDEQTIRFRESRIEKLETILRGRDYEIYNVVPPNTLRKVRKIEPTASADLSITSYLAVPRLYGDSIRRSFPGRVEDVLEPAGSVWPNRGLVQTL